MFTHYYHHFSHINWMYLSMSICCETQSYITYNIQINFCAYWCKDLLAKLLLIEFDKQFKPRIYLSSNQVFLINLGIDDGLYSLQVPLKLNQNYKNYVWVRYHERTTIKLQRLSAFHKLCINLILHRMIMLCEKIKWNLESLNSVYFYVTKTYKLKACNSGSARFRFLNCSK